MQNQGITLSVNHPISLISLLTTNVFLTEKVSLVQDFLPCYNQAILMAGPYMPITSQKL